MLLKIIFVGVLLSLLSIFLKNHLSEFVLPVEIIFLVFAVVLAIEYLQEVFSGLSDIIAKVQFGEEILSSTVKGVGICLMTKIATDICAESGNKMSADVIEFAGRIMLAVIAIPYVEAIINIALAFIE